MKFIVVLMLLIGTACAYKTCVAPLVDVEMGNVTVPANTLMCNPTAVEWVLSLGRSDNMSSMPALPIKRSSDSRYVVTGVYGSDLKAVITTVILIFLPNGDKPITIVDVMYETETSNGINCFDSETQVLTKDDGLKKMSEVKVGDLILIAPETYTPVTGWFHRDESMKAIFLNFKVAGTQLKMSQYHIVMTYPECDTQTALTSSSSPDHPTLAKDVKVGDCVQIFDSVTGVVTVAPVTEITEEVVTGVYAPYVDKDNFYVTTNQQTFTLVTPYSHVFPTELEKMFIRGIMALSSVDLDGINPWVLVMLPYYI